MTATVRHSFAIIAVFAFIVKVLVLGTGSFSLWLGWLYSRQGIDQQHHRA